MLMQIVAKGWGTKSDVDKPEFQKLIKELGLSNWSRVWEYPFAILNSDISPGLKILDAGCGGSFLLSYFLKHEYEIHGVDLTDCPRRSGLHFQKADIRKLPFPENFFDRVFCISVLEHIWKVPGRVADNPMTAINELIRVLKPGGLLSVTTDINRGNWYFLFRQPDFDSKIGKPLGFNSGKMSGDILKSEDTKGGRTCGPNVSIFGFVLKK